MYTLYTKTLSSAGPEAVSATALRCSAAVIQSQRGNAAAIEIGPGSFDAGAGYEFAKPTADVQMKPLYLSPINGADSIDLSQWTVRGTSGDAITILAETY